MRREKNQVGLKKEQISEKRESKELGVEEFQPRWKE